MTVWGDLWRNAFRLYVTPDVPASGPNEPNKLDIFDSIAATEAAVAEIAAAQTAGVVRYETWTLLAAAPGTAAGQGGSVANSDAGTHTDPVVGGTVNNAGQYRWSVSPAGWKRIDNNPQSFDSDLQAIANLTPTDDDVVQRKAGAWTNRSLAQLKTDLAYTVSATGLLTVTGGGVLATNPTLAVPKATIADVTTGTDDTKAVTPLALSEMSALLSEIQDQINNLQDQIDATSPLSIIYISYGQSLARKQSPRVTTAINPKLFTFNGGSDPEEFSNFSGNDAHMQRLSNFVSFTPFIEYSTGEGWAGGTGYQLGLDDRIGKIIFFCPADGSRHWRDLAPGTGRWANLCNAVYRGFVLLLAEGRRNIRIVIDWTQGEADSDEVNPGGGGSEPAITTAQYVKILENLRDAIRFHMTAIIANDISTTLFDPSTMEVFVTPINTQATVYPHTERVQEAHYIKMNSSDGFIIYPPHYQFFNFMDGDGVHLGGQGRRYHAELCASVKARRLFGAPYKPPHVLSATRVGAVITAMCHFPGGSGGVRDTTTFTGPTSWANSVYGIQYWDNVSAAYINVTDATISGSTLTVTLASDPGAGAGELRIAQQPWISGAVANTPRSNFRDAVLSVTAEDSTVLYHYFIPHAVAVPAP